jgi:glycosyltransferase involved in cell wall biosynthesis
MNERRPVALIPAYKPESAVVDIALELVRSDRFQKVVVVNDGSGPECHAIFNALEEAEGVDLLRHHVNLGKGAALKTGLNHVACRYPGALGVVTLDADGQHLLDDVLKVAAKLMEEPHKLILGSRGFHRDVPLRSRFGNLMTRAVMRVVGGLSLLDTQTGLRGIPMEFITPLLRLRALGYDYELDMLLKAKEHGVVIEEVTIQTVYINENKSSHFNPLLDSMKIYFVFVRYASTAISASFFDYLLFVVFYSMSSNIIASLIAARSIAVIAAYWMAKNIAFKSKSSTQRTKLLYVLVAIGYLIISYGSIHYLNASFGLNAVLAKLITEGIMFFASFAVQRDFIFAESQGKI